MALEWLGATDVPHVVGTRYVKMRCPFHDDRHPSASINEHGFVCFPCEITGDAIKLVRREEPDYQTALTILQELTDGTNRPGTPEREWGTSLLG